MKEKLNLLLTELDYDKLTLSADTITSTTTQIKITKTKSPFNVNEIFDLKPNTFNSNYDYIKTNCNFIIQINDQCSDLIYFDKTSLHEGNDASNCLFIDLKNRSRKITMVLINQEEDKTPCTFFINNYSEHLELFQITKGQTHSSRQIVTIFNSNQLYFYDIYNGHIQREKQLTIYDLNAQAQSTVEFRANLTHESNIQYKTKVFHLSPESTSQMRYKVVAMDKSKASLYGNIFIDQNCSQVSSSFQSKHLLISKEAQIISYPELEIHCDDVKCSHGSSTGSLQTEEIFYLESRGIDKAKAKKLLTDAFLHDGMPSLDTHIGQFIKEALH